MVGVKFAKIYKQTCFFKKMTKKVNEDIVLINFLKSGFSTRKLDALLGFSKTRGWKSWEIIKKYNLKKEDKGKLFLYSGKQAGEIINKIISGGNLNRIIPENPSKILEKYKENFVLANSEKAFYDIFSGETRNIIQYFFNPEKKLMGHCQFKGCTQKDTDTVHLARDRPDIFMKCSAKNKIGEGVYFRYDLYKIIRCFLQEHARPKSICFLCKSHHNEMHRLERLSKKKFEKFKRKIVFRY